MAVSSIDENGPSSLHAGFLDGLEEEIRRINRKIIHRHVPEINRGTVIEMAAMVAELRARYLEAALLRLHGGEAEYPPDENRIRDISTRRRMYEEAVHAFNALTRAIERGYVEMPGLRED